ncbi:hypothetical protein ATI61_115192 [Archangium gephyra]|uniref:Uncharacterized protein n=1 Tax=Archangium gephyra TaxID=48 RepID=A0ABX9JQ70_9BACT|nr:hypothetical protein [Archangium gephyra]REG24149.1 hypothetical protein ATI61_115192 [Archangium gephyra]
MSNSLGEQILLAFFDKLVLTATGSVVIVYFTGMAIERYKRTQSVMIELGKLIATGFVELVKKISICDMQISLIAQQAESKGALQFVAQQDREALKDAVKNLGDDLKKVAFLLDEKTRGMVMDYYVFVSDLASSDDLVYLGGLKKAAKMGENLKSNLRLFLPPLPSADSN